MARKLNIEEIGLVEVYSAKGEEVMSLLNREFDSLSNYGIDDCEALNNLQYIQLAIHLCNTIAEEFKWNENSDWAYYVEKYKIDTVRRCLACKNVDLDFYLAKYGFIKDENPIIRGIDYIRIEHDLKSD